MSWYCIGLYVAEGVWATGAAAAVALYAVTRNTVYLLMGLFLLLAAMTAFLFSTPWPLPAGAVLVWAAGRYTGTGLDIRRSQRMKKGHN